MNTVEQGVSDSVNAGVDAGVRQRYQFTDEHRANLSWSRSMRYKLYGYTGYNREVITPLGRFQSMSAAARAHNLTPGGLRARVLSQYQPLYRYCDPTVDGTVKYRTDGHYIPE